MAKMCCIENCYGERERLESRSFFKIPSKESEKKRWMQVISNNLRRGRRTRRNLYVCELHFKKDDIQEEYRTVLKDGSLHKMPRGRKRLKTSSIPCLVKNDSLDPHPSYLEANSRISFDDEWGIGTLMRRISPSTETNRHITNYSIQILKEDIKSINFSTYHSRWTNMIIDSNLLLIYVDNQSKDVRKSILIKESMIPEVRFLGRIIQIPEVDKIQNLEGVTTLMKKIGAMPICEDLLYKPDSFEAVLDPPSTNSNCLLRGIPHKKQSDKRWLIVNNKWKKEYVKSNLKSQRSSLRKPLVHVEKVIASLRSRSSACENANLSEAIQMLPQHQQLMVKDCINAAKAKSAKDHRCINEWIYDCLLFRINSKRTYEMLREKELLILPCSNTINAYLKDIKPFYGFCEETLMCMKVKGQNMKPEEKRGVLVAAEMKLSEGISFDTDTFQFTGFTDPGKKTFTEQKTLSGDHALVLMYQPFFGKWVQQVGTFLSKGCAKSSILPKILIECIVLLENANFRVDAVTTDGESWNRSLWKTFGLSILECSCSHPYDDSRRLWFRSDFPYLLKTLKNFILDHEEIWTPDGVIKLKHWRALLTFESERHDNLKIAHKLTLFHIEPKFFQKMNLKMAKEFFSRNVSSAMFVYKSHIEDLADSLPTVKFINRIDKLIQAMTSRTSMNSLSRKSLSYKIIIDFIDYLEEWQTESSLNHYQFISLNTVTGFYITLNATIELYHYLSDSCNFEFLMAARLNQDSLEGFFGMLQIYDEKDVHDYDIVFSNDYVQAYFSGFIAKKIRTWTSCPVCVSQVFKVTANVPRNAILQYINDEMLYPSDSLFSSLSALEKALSKIIGQDELNVNTFLSIAENIYTESITFIGCPDHRKKLTRRVIDYYILCRSRIMCKMFNKIYNENRENSIQYKKRAKL